MKKILAMLLTVCILLLQISVPTFAQTNTELVFQAENVISGGQGVGYYDSGANGTLEYGVGSVCLRPTEWVKYDISSLAAGIYKAYVFTSNTGETAMDVSINSSTIIPAKIIAATGDYSVFLKREIGFIYIGENAQTFSVRNSGNAAMYFDYFIMEQQAPISTTKKEAENVISETINVGFSDNGLQPNAIGILEKAAGGTGTTVCLRSTEWVKYDISSLSGGTYCIKVNSANNYISNLDVKIDDKLQLSGAEVLSSGSYSTYLNTTLGYIYIKDGAQSITLKNSNSARAMYLDYFELEFITTNRIFDYKLTTDAQNVISYVEGEGFHDEAGFAFTHNNVSQSGCVVLHANDWARFDASCYETGTYILSAYISNVAAATLDINIDDNFQLMDETVASTGSYSTFSIVKLGYIYISEDTQRMTIINSGVSSMYVDYFSLELVSTGISAFFSNEYDAKKVIIGGQNIGYFDSGSSQTIEYFNQGIVLRPTEWAKYDISKLREGNYQLKAILASAYNTHVSVSVSADEQLLVDKAEIAATGSDYSVFAEKDLGVINLSGDQQTIKLSNSDSLRPFYLKGFILISIPITENLVYTGNVNGGLKTNFNNNETIYLSGDITNNYFPSKSFQIITALYSNDAGLKECYTNDITIQMGNTMAINIAIDTQENVDYIKTFLWVNIPVIQPISSEKTIYSGKVTDLYVSADGSDNHAGTQNSPFKTIERAQEKVRTINQNMYGDIIVHLTGEQVLNSTLSFTSEDSGSNNFQIRYQGDSDAIISGGKKVTGWSAVSGTPLWKTTVSDVPDFRQLYINENRGVRARSQWLYWPIATYSDPLGETQINSEIDGYVLSSADFPSAFSRPTDMEFVWMPSWKNIRMPVNNMFANGEGNFVVTFLQPYFDTTQGGDGQPQPSLSTPFYIENAPEFLDQPGEWYFNKTTKELFYYPLQGEDVTTAQCYIPVVETLLTVTGENETNKVKNITFSGITFRYGAWQKPSTSGFVTTQAEQMIAPNEPESDTIGAYGTYPTRIIPGQIQVDYASQIHFMDNTFSHLGSVALSFNNMTTDSSIKGNIFDDISASAITLGDWKLFKESLTAEFCRDNNVYSNLIRRVSVEYQTPAITAYYVKNTKISHNDILDAPYTGISLGWGWGRGVENCAYNEISNNRIENVLYKLKDGGHIYTLDPMTGTTITGNYLKKSGEWKGGIYLDNSSAYITSTNNVFEDCIRWMKLTWYNIHDNTAYNNYSETPGVVSYPDINTIQEAIGKTNGQWPQAALDIIENAGLADEYAYLHTKYGAGLNYTNPELNRLKYIAKPGIVIPAGNIILGGEGVAYHDIVSTVHGIGITDEYNGTGHKYIMNTSQGEWTKYQTQITESGNYDIILNLAATSNGVAVNVYVDGVLVADKAAVINTTTYEVFTDNKVATVPLSAGMHEIKVEHAVKNFGFYSIRLAKQNETNFNRNDGFISSILNAVLAN